MGERSGAGTGCPRLLINLQLALPPPPPPPSTTHPAFLVDRQLVGGSQWKQYGASQDHALAAFKRQLGRHTMVTQVKRGAGD